MGKVSPNPEILKWARESSNWSAEDIAAKMGKPVSVIECWESGQESPTYVQLERLAHDYYKRPVALFFFPKPPETENPKDQFRTLPGSEYRKLSPTILSIIRRAQAMIINLKELNDGPNPAEKHIVRTLRGFQPSDMVSAASETRLFLSVSLEEQVQWADDNAAFENWRAAFWNSGVSVFKDAFGDDAISGFCLYDTEFPVIYINNSLPKTRQIFTLFHELGHLLLETGGVAKVTDDHLWALSSHDRRIEVFCNEFAAVFLVPDHDFDPYVRGQSIEDGLVARLASRYSVSREVILRKLLDRNLVSKEYYESRAEAWIEESSLRKAARKPGGHFYYMKASYLGQQYLELAFSKYYQRRIDVYALSEYLGVKVNSIPSLEEAWLR